MMAQLFASKFSIYKVVPFIRTTPGAGSKISMLPVLCCLQHPDVTQVFHDQRYPAPNMLFLTIYSPPTEISTRWAMPCSSI